MNDQAHRRAARRILNATFLVYVGFAVVVLVAMAVALPGAGARLSQTASEQAGRRIQLARILLVLLFFSATIVNLGVRWAAKIIAARRWKDDNPYPAAFAMAFAQWICFGVYGLFEAVALNHRIAAYQPRKVIIIATAAVLLAALYFLRVPPYVLRSVFAPPPQGEDEAAKADDSGPAN